uniref:Condensin complex subunit 3 n=1 Tax=Bactrocera dorsalis TaxID=27457 RepID=A0A034VAX3_BACDO
MLGLSERTLKLYNDFICRHLASNQIAIRDWALKCGTACSMLYEVLAKDVFEELYSQFFKNHNIRIWETSITCIFELLDRYGLDNFAKQESQNKTKKSGRQLYNTLEFLDSEDDSNVLNAGQGVDVIYMMSHFLDTCDDTCIVSAIIVGFCRLILRGYIKSSDIIEKLLLRYFNPSTDANINQILGVFLENLIQCKRHGLLQPCLLPMLTTVLSAPYENPLHEIRPETITRFIIDSTRQESSPITDGWIHNKIAQTILQEMLNNLTNKDLCKLLAKELITLELSVTQNEQLKRELKETADKLIKADLDPRTVKLIIDFKDLVDGTYNPTRKSAAIDSEGEEDSDDETENDATNDNDTAGPNTARDKTAVSEKVDEPTQQPPPQPPPDGSESVANLTADANAVAAAPEAAPEAVTSSEELPATASETPTVAQQAANDGSIITKDISPSARVPTTYGRENRVGHRYLRKSLNSTRGQSDSEAGDGPPRSPKIRIEARIDSDKKSEQQPAREEHQVRNTRVRRNLRYAEKNAEAQEEVVETAKDATKVRNKRRANLPTLVVDDDTDSNSKTSSDAGAQSQATTTRNTSSPAKRQTKESSKQQAAEQSATKTDKAEKAKDANTEQSKAQPKEQMRTRAREQEKERTPSALPTRLLSRAATRSAAKSNDVEELNTSDVIPPSPPAALSPRTIVRRQRRAGGGDISVANLTDTQRRATRSQSAQSAPNQDSETTEDEAGDRAEAVTTTISSTKVATPARASLKRTFCSTPKLTGATSAEEMSTSPRSEPPLLKRLRAGTPAKEQLRTRRGNASLPPSEPIEETAAKESSTEVVRQTRRKGRQRSISLTLAETEKKPEAPRRSAGAKPSDSSDLMTLPSNTDSATRTRSATRATSLTRADTAPLRTRVATRSSLNTDANAGGKSIMRTSSATRTEAVAAIKSNTHVAENKSDESAPRAEAVTDAADVTRAETDAADVSKKHGDSSSADDESDSAPKEKRRKSGGGSMLMLRRLSIGAGQVVDAGDTSENEAASEVTQRRRSLRNKSGADAGKDSPSSAVSKTQQQRSKIPVRASRSNVMKTRHAAHQVASSLVLAPKAVESNSSSGSGSSSTEEAMKTLGAVLLRKRALTTKATRINLAQRTKGNPVPMELARPTRLRAPASSLPAQNLRSKKR